jgi:hypothetical protein
MGAFMQSIGHIRKSGTLLAPATRTTSTSSTVQVNDGTASGVILYLNVTAASGSGGLTVKVNAIDPTSGQAMPILADTAAITTARTAVFVVAPGASVVGQSTNVVRAVTPIPLPSQWSVTVSHGDGSNYTYSLGYDLIG